MAEAEHDGFLRLFSHLRGTAPEAASWVKHWTKEAKMTQKIEEMPGYDDIFQKILEEMPLHKRLVGLTNEQAVLALPDEVLRQFPDTYLRTLSPETQGIIRSRIDRPEPAS